VAIEVHVVTPEREVWAGKATEVIAHGVDGDVGILTGHAPMLVHLAIGPLQILQEDGAWLKAVVDGGFLHVSTEEVASRVDVLATNAQLEHEIDPGALRTRLEELRSRGSEPGDEHTETEIARAEARLALTDSR
jgi:F-type H+-transporting ATPase subunit epsilon